MLVCLYCVHLCGDHSRDLSTKVSLHRVSNGWMSALSYLITFIQKQIQTAEKDELSDLITVVSHDFYSRLKSFAVSEIFPTSQKR